MQCNSSLASPAHSQAIPWLRRTAQLRRVASTVKTALSAPEHCHYSILHSYTRCYCSVLYALELPPCNSMTYNSMSPALSRRASDMPPLKRPPPFLCVAPLVLPRMHVLMPLLALSQFQYCPCTRVLSGTGITHTHTHTHPPWVHPSFLL